MHPLSLLVASFVVCSAPTFALPVTTAQEELVVLFHRGLDDLLRDPKDAGLRAVAHLVTARLEELPEEFDAQMPLPPEARPILERFMFGPVALRMGTVEQSDFPFFVQLELAGSEAASKTLAGQVASLLEGLGMPAGTADERGLYPIEAPMPSAYGALRDAFVVSVGELVDLPLDLGVTGLPAGVAPDAYARIDVAGLLALAEGAGAGSDVEFEQMIDMLDLMGIGEADMRWSLGADDTRAYLVMRMPGLATELRASAMMPAGPISRRALSAVPSDATWAAIGANNLKGGLALLRNLMGDEIAQLGMGDDPLETLAEQTGVHLERDVLDQLGTSLGAYTSDTTGGGGWLSLVCFTELGDSDRVAQSVARLEEFLNGLAVEEAEGYVQVRRHDGDGARWSTLTFPGLPVPFEPTWTVAEGFFVLGVTPQAATAALAHLRAGGPGLLENPRFAEQLAGAPDALYGLSFLDTPRYLDDGYGIASLACSALANATRSRLDPARDAGPILPSYAQLAAGAKAWVTSTRVEGDDLVEESRMDRSWLVNGTALAGFLASSPLTLLVPMLAFRVSESIEDARQTAAMMEDWDSIEPMDPLEQVQQDILTLHYAAAEYAMMNGGEFPEVLELLVTPDENGMTYLGSYELPLDPWGYPYRYTKPASGESVPSIASLGADGVEGGEGYDADITNTELLERQRREAEEAGDGEDY